MGENYGQGRGREAAFVLVIFVLLVIILGISSFGY
ncbi:sporulation protein YjcZ [Peribacillus glennii]|uniref:Sporulation protein YjcZ n=1 Tax=Peribacillus glennii TaxID=2303991 RepID=A0A372L7G0_9BACI|nr:sporulation protein YjcZ [Peribacillus glennii]RFU61198.1 sporulation protein YjcZ [Peribacillus glennii]